MRRRESDCVAGCTATRRSVFVMLRHVGSKHALHAMPTHAMILFATLTMIFICDECYSLNRMILLTLLAYCVKVSILRSIVRDLSASVEMTTQSSALGDFSASFVSLASVEMTKQCFATWDPSTTLRYALREGRMTMLINIVMSTEKHAVFETETSQPYG